MDEENIETRAVIIFADDAKETWEAFQEVERPEGVEYRIVPRWFFDQISSGVLEPRVRRGRPERKEQGDDMP